MKNDKSLELGTILFLIFLVLKLTNNISWSWWWVTSPIWLPISLIILIGGIAVLIGLIFYLKK
jgi:hypothetical protein